MKTYFIMCSTTILFSSIFLNITILYFPLISYNKFKNQTIPGIILSFMPLGYIFSFFVANLFEVSKFYYCCHNFLISIATIMFFFTTYISNSFLFIICSSLLGLIQGISSSIIYGISFSTLSYIYNEDKEIQKKVIIAAKFVSALGILICSIFCGMMYKYIGIWACFIITPSIFIILILVILISKIDLSLLKSKKVELNIFKFFKNKKIMLAAFFSGIGYSFSVLIRPGYSINMKTYYNLNNGKSSYIYGIYGLSSIISNFLLIFIPKRINNNVLIQISYIFGILFLIFIGPCEFLFNKNLILVYIGLILGGISYSSVLSIITIYFSELIIIEFNEVDTLEAYLLGSYISFFVQGFSAIVSKLLGGIISYEFGFPNGMAFYGFFSLFIIIIYFFIEGKTHWKKLFNPQNDFVELTNEKN